MKADIGVIGLAVMGQNLVLNMNDHGFTVAVFNRTATKVEEFLNGPAKNTQVIGSGDLKSFFTLLKRPRKVMLMVKAGQAVDDLISECLPFLEEGDIIIDGGNSNYVDTERRVLSLAQDKILFVGAGVSGGEEGARHGPSIMPGGNVEAWPHIKAIFQSIAAKADDGTPCCDWVGEGGAGHYVKMVHNGIEYGDMQLICEAYQLLKDVGACSPKQIQEIFTNWNKGDLSSYLIEITAQILAFYESDGTLLLDKIVDVAGQKGTGKWTVASALDQGVPATLMGESVFARFISSLKSERVKAAELYNSADRKKGISSSDTSPQFIKMVGDALYASKIISYAQGFMLMRAVASERKWHLNYGSIALLWRGGCIIRSAFLSKIKAAYDNQPDLANLLFDPFFKNEILKAEKNWREAVTKAIFNGTPAPCLNSALCFFDGYRSEKLPANLLQAQRDFFGAHTYERTDKPRGEFFHTNWTGQGGAVSSTTYTV